MLKRIKFTESGPQHDREFCSQHCDRRLTLCADGVRQWFYVPKRCDTLDLLLSSEPLTQGYAVVFDNMDLLVISPECGRQPSWLKADEEGYLAPTLTLGMRWLLFEFARKHGVCYVAVEA